MSQAGSWWSWFRGLSPWAKAAFAGEMLLGLGLAIYLRQSVFPVYGVPLGVDSVVIHLLVFWLVPAIGLGALLSRWKQLSDDVNFFIALAGAWLFAILLTFLWVSREAVLA